MAEFWVKVQGLGDWPYVRLKDHKLFHVKQSALKVANHPSTWQQLRSPEGAAKYITAYASKPRQKQVPKEFQDVGRFWGNSPDLALGMPEAIIDTDEEELRDWLCRIGHPVADWEILPKVVLKFDKF